MKYLSTRNSSLQCSFFEILFQGLSKEGGLFLPHEWPHVDLGSLKNKSYEEVAVQIIHPFVGEEITEVDLRKIVNKSYINFSNTKTAPVASLEKNKYINLKRSNLELSRNLEQMRALENNMKIDVLYTDSDPLSVDTEADLEEIKNLMEK